MKISLFLIYIIAFSSINAQYATPGTGVVWNMDSLVFNSSAVQNVSSNNYKVIEDITITASDSIFILNNNLRFASGVRITVSDGSLYIKGGINTGNLIAEVPGQSYNGFRLEGNSIVEFDSVVINECGGIRALTPNFKITNSTLENNPTGVNTSGVIQISSGKPEILNNVFKNNQVSAISSAANAIVAPIIKGNTLINNVTNNSNRPQISLSPSGASDTTYLENNSVEGDPNNENSGGIAFSSITGSLSNVVIRNNNITNNRYGILLLGNGFSAIIDNNKIKDNNIHNSPNLSGSGINFNGDNTSLAIVSNNTITGNLWGITILESFKVNLGDSHINGANPGLNIFSENEHDGELHSLFNNTANQVLASNNCWELNLESTAQNAESVISHKVDDSALGEVVFNPIMLCNVVGLEENKVELLSYPNPTKDYLNIELPNGSKLNTLQLVSSTGKRCEIPYSKSNNEVTVNLSSVNPGVYFIFVQCKSFVSSKKIIVQ